MDWAKDILYFSRLFYQILIKFKNIEYIDYYGDENKCPGINLNHQSTY